MQCELIFVAAIMIVTFLKKKSVIATTLMMIPTIQKMIKNCQPKGKNKDS